MPLPFYRYRFLVSGRLLDVHENCVAVSGVKTLTDHCLVLRQVVSLPGLFATFQLDHNDAHRDPVAVHSFDVRAENSCLPPQISQSLTGQPSDTPQMPFRL